MSIPILSYKGIWNGYLNTPLLTDGTGELGATYLIANNDPDNGQQLFIVNRDLGSGIKSWLVSQYIYYDGSQWQPYSPSSGAGSGTVTSVDATGGTGIIVTGGPITTSGSLTITNTLPDQVVDISGGTGIQVLGTYPNFTINATGGGSGTVTSITAGTGLSGGVITTSGTISMPNTGTAGTYGDATHIPVFTTDAQGRVTGVVSTPISGGTGTVTSIDISGSTGISSTGGPITTNGVITITNTAPDQLVTLNSGSGISVTGTYPTFTITNVSGSTGTVTQVATDSTLTGGPITSTGTLGINLSHTNSWLTSQNFTDIFTGNLNISGATTVTPLGGSGTRMVTVNNTGLLGATSIPTGTVTSIDISGSTGISTSGGPITSSGSIVVTNTAPDQLVTISGSTGISVSGTYPNFTLASTSQPAGNYITALTGDVTASGPGSTAATIANNAVTYGKMQVVSTTSRLLGSSSTTTPVQELSIGSGLLLSGSTLTATGGSGTVTSINISGSTGISATGGPVTTSGVITVTNTAPDLTVTLSGSTGISIAGSYPNFTITNTAPALTSGTVTSVGLSLPAELTVTNSPVTSSGTLTGTWASQAANRFFAAPSGSTGTPLFRSINTPDLGTGTANSGTYLRGDLTWAAVSASPGGSSTQVQFNNAGTTDGAVNVTIDLTDERLILLSTSGTTAVTAPSSGLKVWGDNRAGLDQPHFTPTVGIDYWLQPSLGQKVVSQYSFGSSVSGTGAYASSSAAGTTAEVVKTYDATNLLPNYSYRRITSNATANVSAEFFVNVTGRGPTMGNNVYGGGFKFMATFGFPTYRSTERVFIGVTGVAAQNATTTDPSAWLNMLGVAKDVGDTNLQFMTNAGAGTATKVDTGITANGNDVYRLTLFVPSDSSRATLLLEAFTKGAVTIADTTFTGAKLMGGLIVYTHLMVNTGAVASAVSIAIMNQQLEEF